MRVHGLPLLLFAAQVACFPIIYSRDASAIVSSIRTVGEGFDSLKNAVGAMQGGPSIQLLPIGAAQNNLDSAIRVATSVASSSPILSDQDSVAVAIEVMDLLPKISGYITTQESKVSAVESTGIIGTGSAVSAFSNMQKEMSGMISALQRIVAPSIAQALKPVGDNVNASFQNIASIFAASAPSTGSMTNSSSTAAAAKAVSRSLPGIPPIPPRLAAPGMSTMGG